MTDGKSVQAVEGRKDKSTMNGVSYLRRGSSVNVLLSQDFHRPPAQVNAAVLCPTIGDPMQAPPNGFVRDSNVHPRSETLNDNVIDLERIVVLPSWLRKLRIGDKRRKADTVAALLLATTLSLYECTPHHNTWGIQINYAELASILSFTKRQTSAAMHRLQDAGLIEMWLKHETIETPWGHSPILGNILYVRPVIKAIRELSQNMTIKSRKFREWQSPLKRESCPDPGWVYLISAGGLHKIGMTSKTPKQRIKQLQPMSPNPLILVLSAYTSNPAQLESALHLHFDSKRKHGEWFDLTPEDVAETAKTGGDNVQWVYPS